MINASTRRVIHGGLVHALSLTEVQYLPRALISISDLGVIDWIKDDVDPTELQQVLSTMTGQDISSGDFDVWSLEEGQFLLPGFVDTHTHAPQFPNMGVGQQYELLDWLANVTFPIEARFSDLEYAKKTYGSVVQKVLNCGTTTCCYYGSLHLEATKALADICHTRGQRAFVGKCNMDRNASPTYQEASASESISDTKNLIQYISGLADPNTSPLVEPILTPRFAICCSDELLSGLNLIAKENPEMAIQTHISENASEIAYTKELFPKCESYAGVYDRFGLLRKKTILAHGVHLGDDELTLIKSRDAGVSHCPTSNFNLRSGMAKVGEMLDRDIKVGLGTDVSGGYSPSILTAIQHASICSKMIALQTPSPPKSTKFSGKQLPIATLLYLATMGGADLCGLSNRIGNFAPGKEFDALLVDVKVGGEGMWWESGTPLEAMLERFLFCGDGRNIPVVWVRNRIVGGSKMNL